MKTKPDPQVRFVTPQPIRIDPAKLTERALHRNPPLTNPSDLEKKRIAVKITKLQITIEPWISRDSMKELRVEVIADGTRYTFTTPLEDNDFESHFDHMMEDARLEILRLVKQAKK